MSKRSVWNMNDINKLLFFGFYNVELISDKLTKKVMEFIEDETVNDLHLEGVLSPDSNYSKDGIELLKPCITKLVQDAIAIQYEYETPRDKHATG